MNKITTLAFVAIVLFIGLPISRVGAATEVSVDFFYENLDSYGDWVEVGDYGYCWHPRDVNRDWRPYSDGRWVYSDAGWTWVSDEPYGWAVYHYGRWAHVQRIGWVWVPGTEWGPAWVSWRHNDRYLGWAPLPPEARFSATVGFGHNVDVSFDIGPTYYSFVQSRDIGAPRLREVIVEPQQNITIINQTTNITNIRTVNNVVVNEGPSYDVVSAASAQPIQRVKLERTTTVQGDPGALASKIEGGSLRVAAPAISAAKPEAKPKKVAAKVDKAEVNHGWKDAGPPAEVEKLRAKMKSEPKAPAEAVKSPVASEAKPKADVPSKEKPLADKPQPGAKVATPTPKVKDAPAAPGESEPPAPEVKGKTIKPSHPTPDTEVPPADKGKHHGVTDLPPAGAGEKPIREPKNKREAPESPARGAVPEKHMDKTEPKPEAGAGSVRHPDADPAKPEGKEKKAKDKEKDKEKDKSVVPQ